MSFVDAMMNITILRKLHCLKNIEWVCIADIQNFTEFHVCEEIIF